MADNGTNNSRGELWKKLFDLHANLAKFRSDKGEIDFSLIAGEIIKQTPALAGKKQKIADGLEAYFSGEPETIGSWSKAGQDVSAQVTKAFEQNLANIAKMDVVQCLDMARTLKYPVIYTRKIPLDMAEREKYAEALRYVAIDNCWALGDVTDAMSIKYESFHTFLNRPEVVSVKMMGTIKAAVVSPEGLGYENEKAFFEDTARIKSMLLKAIGKNALPDKFNLAMQITFAFRSYIAANNMDNSALAEKLGMPLIEFKKISFAPFLIQNIPLLLKASDCETIYELLAKGRDANRAFAENLVGYSEKHGRALYLVMEEHGDSPTSLSDAIFDSTEQSISAQYILNFTTNTHGLNPFDIEVILSHYEIANKEALLARGAELEKELQSYRNGVRCITVEQDDNKLDLLSRTLDLRPHTIELYLSQYPYNLAFSKHRRLPEALGFDSPKSFLMAGDRAYAKLQPLLEMIEGSVVINEAQQIALKNAILDKVSSSNMLFEEVADIVGTGNNHYNFKSHEKIMVSKGLKWVEGFGFETVSDFLSGDENKSVWKRIKPYEAKLALESFLAKSGTSIETLAETCGIKHLKEQIDAVTPESSGMCFSVRPLMFAMRMAKSESLDAFIGDHLDGHIKKVFLE